MAELQMGQGGGEETPKAPEGMTAVGEDGKTVTVTVDDPTATETASQAAKEAQRGGSEGNEVQRPEWLPEKFWNGNLEESQKKMGDAYTALEQKQGGKKAEGEEGDEAEDKKKKTDEKTGLKIKPEDKPKTIDFEVAEKEFVDNDGKITDETYAAYEKMGLSREAVNSYIAGQQAQVKNMETALHGVAGDGERMKQVLEWALSEVDEDTVAVYNDAIDNGNTAQAKVALKGIVAEYDAANGKPPNILDGDTSMQKADGQGYASISEMTKAMADERYKTDSAYRAKVVKRVAASDF